MSASISAQRIGDMMMRSKMADSLASRRIAGISWMDQTIGVMESWQETIEIKVESRVGEGKATNVVVG